MINQETLTIEWIKKVSAENRNADKILVEKVIRALLLLEGLVNHKLSFVFKGGTALMLLLGSTKRLSIDIDIILPETPGNLEEIFNQLAKEQGFNRAELQHRPSDSKIAKSHYKFFYLPIHKTHEGEEYILLDILHEKAQYKQLVSHEIKSSFISSDDNIVIVKVPTLEGILGDKLTAFAPKTTGIPYIKGSKSMSMEIIKQLYDIGNLFDECKDISLVTETFEVFAETELKYRDLSTLSYEDVLDDIYETSLCIVTRGKKGDGDFKELQDGIKRVKSFIFSEAFHLEKAITFASKAAYLAIIIKNKAKLEKYSSPKELKNWTIENANWSKINKLKGSNPEAFFYWYKIHQILQ